MLQLYKLGRLSGYPLHATDGEIGKLKEIYFDDQYWIIRYFVVHTGNWLLGKDVLITPTAVKTVDAENQYFEVDLSRYQIENCPPLDSALPVSRHYEIEYYRHYGWIPYWSGDPILGTTPPVMPPVIAGADLQIPEHPHLRSSATVTGYHISATHANIGHVADFIIAAPGWAIRYLEIDTHNWLPGKHVLVEPAWIQQINWLQQTVSVNLTREKIKTAPAYDPDKTISKEYELALYKHYGESIDQD